MLGFISQLNVSDILGIRRQIQHPKKTDLSTMATDSHANSSSKEIFVVNVKLSSPMKKIKTGLYIKQK